MVEEEEEVEEGRWERVGVRGSREENKVVAKMAARYNFQ